MPWRFDRYLDNVFFHAVEARDYPLFEHDPYVLALTSKMVEVAVWAKLDSSSALTPSLMPPGPAAKQIPGERGRSSWARCTARTSPFVGNDRSVPCG